MKSKLKCILIIDDDEPTNFFTRVILEDAGYAEHVITLQSGEEALDYLAKSEAIGGAGDKFPSPDLILLDLNMPAMNGWEFLEEYRKLDVAHRIIMVMLTTSLFPEDRERAETIAEISGFENKPISEEKINAILDKYFTGIIY